MSQPILKKLLLKENLTQAEAAETLEYLISEEAADSQIAAILIALAAKGETEEELAGFAETMRSRSAKINSDRHVDYIDTCGTGGSSIKTFNVSTATAFVVAAAGLPVAKHGNVGVTTKSGSADVLRALGVKIDLAFEQVRASLDNLGICFMFAPQHHAATRRVAMVRRELGVRTIFNWLGPLTNPAGAPFQIIGVSDPQACEHVAMAVARLGTKKTWVVRGDDGLDEITLAASTRVFEITGHSLNSFVISPEEFGVEKFSMESLRGGSAEENAAVIRQILAGQRADNALNLVLVNAAAALYLAGIGDDLKDAMAAAREAIATGGAQEKLNSLIRFTGQS